MMAPNHWKGFAVIVVATALAVWLVVPLINKGINSATSSTTAS